MRMRVPHLSLAVRNIFRRPGFAVVAIMLLALGAGANAAVFSVVRGVLLRPLPYPSPDRLVAMWPTVFVSNEEVAYWRDHTHSFDEIAAQSPGWLMGLVAEGGEPLKITGAKISDNLFRALGASAALGRTIEPGESLAGKSQVAVLSHGLWRRRFAADPNILGRTIQLDQQPHVVVGVMPPGFEVLQPGTDLWAPLLWDPAAGNFKATFSQSIARLKPGVSVDTASRELQALAPTMRTDLGRANDWGQTMRVASLQETITGNVRPTLLILLGAVGLILMLASVNLGTLVLGRSIERVAEMAVRTALGASRWRLVKQVVVEQAVLALAGSLAGIGIARLTLPALVSRIPPEVPRTGEIALDWTVLGIVLAGSIAVAVVVAVVPALLTARPSLLPLLRQSRGTDTPARRRALGALVSVQIALAVVLGIGAALMLRSLWNLQHVDPGFRPDNVLTFRLQTTSKYRALSDGLPYMQRIVDRIHALPGVVNVGAVAHLPLSNYSWTTNLRRSDQVIAPGAPTPSVGWRFVGWDYFQAMGIPLVAGRMFIDADIATSAKVAILNETLARQFFGGSADAIGKTVVQAGAGGSADQIAEVVGVVGDVHHVGLDRPVQPEVFRPFAQTFMFPMAFVVRTSGPPSQVAAPIRQAVFEIDPVVPVAELQPYATWIADALGRPRLLSYLLSVFAGVGLLLGLVGVYGVAAYRVRQREREIGIRLALGGDPVRMSRSVLAQGLVYAAIGLIVGLPAALALSRVMASVVFGISPRDPLTFATLPVAIVLVTLAACYLPARRAARVDPVVAIRAD
jgi:putative ABC transport system permease protein